MESNIPQQTIDEKQKNKIYKFLIHAIGTFSWKIAKFLEM